MLNELVQTIETLRERIGGHRPYFSEGKAEARTRAALIDPMLSALGWNVADPSLVEIEPRTKEGWADYALVSGGRTVMFVEAKKLSEDIDQHFQQTINYAVGENVGRSPKIDYCAVTNGDAWRVLDVREQEIIMSASITRDDSPKAALQFLGLWRQSLRNGGFDAAVEPLFSQETLTPPPPAPEPQPVTPVPAAAVSPADWTPLTASFETTGRPAPESIQFPDGTSASTKHWRDILSQSALWLNAKGKLTTSHCPVPMSASKKSKRYLFNTEPKHVSGDDFKHPVKLGYSGMFMEANLSASDIVKLARREVEKFGFNPAAVYLRFPS